MTEKPRPKMMEIDWVRVWQCGEDAASRPCYEANVGQKD